MKQEGITPQLSADSANTGEAAAAVQVKNVSLCNLPNDVLLHVWIHLDDPAPLSQVNKHFHKLSQDTLWRAKWLMQRYELFLVIFEAIARPKLFTPALLYGLLRLGAPLSRNLVQLIKIVQLAQIMGKDGKPLSFFHRMDEGICWGRVACWDRIGSTAYFALVLEAAHLYESTINVEWLEDLDSCMFENLRSFYDKGVMPGDLPEGKFNRVVDSVRRAFKEGSFMPLPLVIKHSGLGAVHVRRSTSCEVTAFMNDSELVLSALKNGYALTTNRMERIVDRWVDHGDSNEVMALAEGLLEINKVVNISQDYAKRAFTGADTAGTSLSRFNTALREVLMQLNERSALPFRVEDVIKELQAAQSSEETAAETAK